MSSGISFIKCTEVNQLKSMVQTIISEHEIFVLGRAKFSVFDQFEEKIDYCPSCNPTLEKINLTMGKLFGQVSSQLIGMGNFTISILDHFYSMSQAAQQSKDTIKSLQTKSSQFHQYTSQLQTQNQNLRSRVQELQQMLVRTQNQLSTIQELNQLNQKLKNQNNFLENKLFVLENQLQIQKRQEVEILQKELEEVRKKYVRTVGENQILEKQVMRLNQELSKISTILNKPSCIQTQYIYSPEIQNKDQIWQKNSGEIYRTIHQLYQGSPEHFQITSNSLFRDIGSEKVFNFNLFSPSVSNYDMNYGLQVESHLKYSTFEKRNLSIKSKQSSNKENQNSNTNFKLKNISEKDQIKQGVISVFLTQKVDKGIQVSDFQINQSSQETQSINVNSTEAFIEIPVEKTYEEETAQKLNLTQKNYSKDDVMEFKVIDAKIHTLKKLPQKQDEFLKEKLEQQKQEPLYLKWAKYLSEKCIKNRIKSKTKLILG